MRFPAIGWRILKMPPEIEELESLLISWEEGDLSEDGVQRVREILRSNPKAQEFYLDFQMLNSAFKQMSNTEIEIPASDLKKELNVEPARPRKALDPKPTQPTRRVRMSHAWMIVAASALFCLIMGRLVFLEMRRIDSENSQAQQNPKEPDASPNIEATSQGIALVTELVDVTWRQGQAVHQVGDALSPGILAIESGFAQVEFFCGAMVILEGPAVLDLKSATLASIETGRLRAHVPPAARGFSIHVGEMRVVDLGTEFALAVTDEGSTVQVFDGEVELHGAEQPQRKLVAGEGLTRNRQGEFVNTEIAPSEFLDSASLESRAAGRRDARFENWREWSNTLRRDPRVIAYYAFENGDTQSRRLASSVEPRNSELAGAIVGARPVAGRWSNKRALEFKRPADRVRVDIPGEYSSLSFCCWVKIDSLDRWYNSLFLTDNYNQGEPHWQILDTGQLFFSVRVSSEANKGPEHREVLSPAFWNPSMSGQWLHLATTYDVEHRTVTHYLNGEVLSEELIPERQIAQTTRFGRSTIGNWSQPQRPADQEFAIRNLNGSIDEFVLLSGSLSSDEIREIYDHGKP